MKHHFLSLTPNEMPYISEADIHIHRGLSIIKSHVLGASALCQKSRMVWVSYIGDATWVHLILYYPINEQKIRNPQYRINYHHRLKKKKVLESKNLKEKNHIND